MKVRSRKYWLVLSLLAAVVALSVGAQTASAGGQRNPLVRPNAKFRGISFEEWNVLFVEYQIRTMLGGEDLNDTIRGVRFLPVVLGPGEFEFDVTLRPGEGFVNPAFLVFGELYDNGGFDTPQDVIDLMILETTFLKTQLNGKVLLQGFGDELSSFGYGPTFFDEPIYYSEPQPRGPDLNAVAATFTVGIGSVYRPLPIGKHKLVHEIDSLFFGVFKFTYNITVAPRGRR